MKISEILFFEVEAFFWFWMNFSREFDDFLENLDFDIDLDIDLDFLESGDMVSNNDLIDFWFSSDVGDDFPFGLLMSGMVKGESTEGL